MLKELDKKIEDTKIKVNIGSVAYEKIAKRQAYIDCKAMLESVIEKIDSINTEKYISEFSDRYAFSIAIEVVLAILRGESERTFICFI